MNNNFDRLFKLAQKTKSTLVVYDREGNDHCVVLGIEQFEKMSEQTSISPLETIAPAPKTPVIDLDLKTDEEILEALNEKISNWRASQPVSESEEPVLNTDSVQEVPVPEISTVDHEPEEPTQSIAVPVASPLVAQSPTKSSSWHRLGDVMAQTLKPKMPEVRYEEIGEPEVALPVTRTDEPEVFSEPESLDDEPLFLEEPVS